MKINELYPCGGNFDAFLEYRLACPQCGETIHIYLPAERDTRSYTFGSNTCHPFIKSIDRGGREFYAHKAIHIREDFMGGRISLYDSYHVYPLVDGEPAEERRARLAQIKGGELAHLLKNAPEKREWVIAEVVQRNETVLNALEPLLKEYEKSPEKWPELDAAVQGIGPGDDAKSILRRLGLLVESTSSAATQNPALAVNMNSVSFGTFGSFACPMPARPAPNQSAKETWLCACGSLNTSKFCPNCGTPRGK